MSQSKYTLPRHTNLAKQSSRTGAFLIDIAIAFAIALAFFFGCFQLIFKSKTDTLISNIEKEQLNSGLYVLNENGVVDRPIVGYGNMTEYYYLHYLPGVNLKEGLEGCKLSDQPIKLEDGSEVTPQEYFVPEWYNKTILNIANDPDAEGDKGLFTYVKVDGVYDKTQVGVKKESTSEDDANKYLYECYRNAYQNDFESISYYADWNISLSRYYTVEFVSSAVIAIIITYIIIPYILKNGQTAGKKAFGLGLASTDGYAYNSKKLPLRAIPVILLNLAFLIPVWNSIFVLMLVILIIFLVSFALSMASPLKKSLHDYPAGSIVIDLKTSIIFNNEMEEEEYLLKEDNLTPEDVVTSGEEPELKYEK